MYKTNPGRTNTNMTTEKGNTFKEAPKQLKAKASELLRNAIFLYTTETSLPIERKVISAKDLAR